MDEANRAVEIFMSLPAPLQWLALIVIAAKMITPWTSTRAKNPVLDKLLLGLNALAMNVGKDRNEDSHEIHRRVKP